jgi:hypothetical protein
LGTGPAGESSPRAESERNIGVTQNTLSAKPERPEFRRSYAWRRTGLDGDNTSAELLAHIAKTGVEPVFTLIC